MATFNTAACALGLGLSLVGCDLDRTNSTAIESGKAVKSTSVQVETGRRAYATYCVGCHGAKGDGNGNAARFLRPRPHDLTTGRFKFSSTRAGSLPTDADLRRTIVHGLKGSAMPGWKMLSASTLNALIAYVKTFSPRWDQPPPALLLPEVVDPFGVAGTTVDAIERGEAVYHGLAACWACHPAYVSTETINKFLTEFESPTRDAFRPKLNQSEGKVNTDGEWIDPPDFRRDFVRAGDAVNDLYRSIAAGISGTAMPTWIDSIDVPSSIHPDSPLASSSDLWALAYYVQSLIIDRPQRLEPGEFVLRSRAQRILGPQERWTPRSPTSNAAASEFEPFEEEND